LKVTDYDPGEASIENFVKEAKTSHFLCIFARQRASDMSVEHWLKALASICAACAPFAGFRNSSDGFVAHIKAIRSLSKTASP
jgi:hypothetical protein